MYHETYFDLNLLNNKRDRLIFHLIYFVYHDEVLLNWLPETGSIKKGIGMLVN